MSFPTPSFFIDPYIVKGGITFLWGDTSIGKSPLTWEMAAAIGRGGHFFGLPCQAGRVLYIETDTPLQSLHERIKLTNPAPPNVWFLHSNPLSIPFIGPESEEYQLLKEAREEISPDVVFINSLRKVHDLDDKDSATPKKVYSFFQKMFPEAGLVFIHHEKKRNSDPKAVVYEKEGFSGAKNWLNDAQCGLHLETFTPSKDNPENLRLYHRKSQVSRTCLPLPLTLADDGTAIESPLFKKLLLVYEALNGQCADLGAGEQDIAISRLLDTSTTTAKRLRLKIQGGAFPGSRRFLEGKDE